MATTQANRPISIETVLGTDTLVVEHFTMSDELEDLYQIEVELLSTDPQISFDGLVGTKATIKMQMEGGSPRFFNGIVSRFVQTHHERTHAYYRATLVPWLWFLTRASDCRIFQNKTVVDIIKEVFQGHGFSDYTLKLNATYRTREYCVQYRETDFNFVSRLMEQEGIYYYFKHEDGQHQLILIDSKDNHEAFSGYETVDFKPRRSQKGEHDESIVEWSMEKEVQTGAYVLSDWSFKTPASPVVVNDTISRSHENASFEIFDYPGEYEQRADGEAYAKLRIEELQARHEILRGEATARGISTGSKFDLQGHGREDQNRSYIVTSTHCQGTNPSFDSTSESATGEVFSCTFTAIPFTEQFRPSRTTPKPIVQGPQTAYVVGPSGQDIHSDEFGRVKIKFHWDRAGQPDENASCWVRVSQVWAGKKWGGINIPRIGQEVIVEFLEGDPDRPIITGRVYNARSTVPYPLPDKQTVTTLKTNSSPDGGGFNELRFEDKKGNEQIFIHAEKDFDLRIKNDAKEWIGNEHHVIVKKDQFEKIEGKRNTTITGDVLSKIDGSVGEKIKGDVKVAIDGAQHITVKGKQSSKVDGDVNLKGGANLNTEAGQKISIKAGTDLHGKAGQNYAMDAGMAVHIKAGMTVVIEAGTQLSLKVGGNYIDIGPAGVSIFGTMVNINSGGSAGSGGGSSPTAPEAPEAPDAPVDPKEAADDAAGEKDVTPS